MKDVRMSNTQLLKLYKIIISYEQRDGPPCPSAHHVMGILKKSMHVKQRVPDLIKYLFNEEVSRCRNTMYARGGQFEKDNEMQ